MANAAVLADHLNTLAAAYEVVLPNTLRWVQIDDFRLPPGYQRTTTTVLVEIPKDYPLTPPGVGNARIYVPADLRYQDRSLRDLHSHRSGGYDGMAWLCFQSISWDATRDDLASVLEIVRTTLTNPPTK